MTADNVEYLPARRVSDGKFVLKPVRVDGCGFARLQDTHADQRCGVIQTDCQKAARVRVIEDDGQVAGRASVALLGDGLIENPGMPPAAKRVLRTG